MLYPIMSSYQGVKNRPQDLTLLWQAVKNPNQVIISEQSLFLIESIMLNPMVCSYQGVKNGPQGPHSR